MIEEHQADHRHAPTREEILQEEALVTPQLELALPRKNATQQDHADLLQDRQETPTFHTMEDLATGHTTLLWISTD